MPFGRTRFFIGIALILLAISGIAYYLLKDSRSEQVGDGAALPHAPGGAVSSVDAGRGPSVSPPWRPAEKAEETPAPDSRPPAVAESAREAEMKKNSAPAPQKTDEVSPPSSSSAERSEQHAEQTAPQREGAPLPPAREAGVSERVVKHVRVGFWGGFVAPTPPQTPQNHLFLR